MRNLKLNLVFIFLLATLSFISSCDKSEHRLEKQAEILEETKIDNFENSQSNLEWTLSIPYPTSNSLQELFQKDRLLIRNIVNNNDEIQAESYVRNLADQIAGFYYYNRNIDLRVDFANDPNGVIVFGLFYAAKEYIDQEGLYSTHRSLKKKKDPSIFYMPPDPESCFWTAIGTFIGITEAKSIWNAIIGGASERAIIGTLKLLARRVATAITVVIMIKEAGECLGWW
jgi:hypothetical protein